MFSTIRRNLNPATLLAFVALVFALTGGAFAATGGNGGSGDRSFGNGGHATLTASAAKAKPKAKAGPRGPAGPAGKNGATGTTGAAGAMGPAGPQGPAGASGAAGEKGAGGEPGAAGAPGKAGKEGSPWTAGGVLPAGKTETGTWGVDGVINPGGGNFTTEVDSPISFTIPLAARLASTQVHFIAQGQTGGAGCSGGTAEAPTAEAGNLCVYDVVGNLTLKIVDIEEGEFGAGKTGATLVGQAEEKAAGEWVLTAPAE